MPQINETDGNTALVEVTSVFDYKKAILSHAVVWTLKDLGIELEAHATKTDFNSSTKKVECQVKK